MYIMCDLCEVYEYTQGLVKVLNSHGPSRHEELEEK